MRDLSDLRTDSLCRISRSRVHAADENGGDRQRLQQQRADRDPDGAYVSAQRLPAGDRRKELRLD